jgi:hypothetical protein
VEVHDSIIL